MAIYSTRKGEERVRAYDSLKALAQGEGTRECIFTPMVMHELKGACQRIVPGTIRQTSDFRYVVSMPPLSNEEVTAMLEDMRNNAIKNGILNATGGRHGINGINRDPHIGSDQSGGPHTGPSNLGYKD
jgi:hypothetical protein